MFQNGTSSKEWKRVQGFAHIPEGQMFSAARENQRHGLNSAEVRGLEEQNGEAWGNSPVVQRSGVGG